MSIEVKQKMKDEFENFLPEYGLTEFYYRSFLRLHGYSSKVSATDVVYGVISFLESFVEDKGGSTAEAELFWFAYAALSLNNQDKLRKGVQTAIQVQRAILRQGSSTITKSGFIKSGRKFRWVKLEDAVDTKMLGYLLLLDRCFERERSKNEAFDLYACLAQEPNKVLIVGVCGKLRIGAIQGNSFEAAFKSAAEEIGVEYFHELFESSWIMLDTIAVNSFMIIYGGIS